MALYDTATDGYVPPFRYYVPEQGRWLTPDPLAGDVTNPQSLNRYAYVRNNPTTLIDPLGLDCSDVQTARTRMAIQFLR
jgi:RHS repeat-associated protein